MTVRNASPDAAAERMHHRLTNGILDQRHEPGARLDAERIAEEFSAQPSLVRDVLWRLVGERLAQAEEDGGFSVSPLPDAAWLKQVQQFRVMMETWAVREVARRRHGATLSRLHKLVEEHRAAIALIRDGSVSGVFSDYEPGYIADAAFHNALVDSAGNQVVAQAYRDLNPHLHYARVFLGDPYPGAIVDAIAEHETILSAAKRGEADAAVAAMLAHLNRASIRLEGLGPRLAKRLTPPG